MAKHELRSPETRPLPGPSPEVEAERRRTLRRHKAFVTGLLIIAALIFLSCSWWQSQHEDAAAWVGYVRAAAEAGMVGGLADWFAVTALFRHPMGIPIPHTALIPKKKDQLGDQLSGFVGENFLNAELITEKVEQAHLPERAAQWLRQPTNVDKVSAQVGKFTARVVAAIDPHEAETLLRTMVVDKLAEPEWGPPAGRVLEQLIADGRTEPLIEELAHWAHKKALGAEELIIRIIDERKPVWAPRFVNNLIGEKVYRELIKFTEAVSADPNHEARHAARRWLSRLAHDLQYDPAMIDRVERWKGDVMGSQALAGAAGSLWRSTSASLIEQAEDPNSLLRTRISKLAREWGQRLSEDKQLRLSLDDRVRSAARFLADNYAEEITAIISDTVRRWDAEEASEKIELMVGKDLQFIRLNGTIVGALAGLAIYTVNQLLFGA
ncbi:DUF445 family protein [Corynebacterium poyangense]|uniref:DUF445 family protein n=1 Tax=Corynebacterium poyangense TaxID=2684405 RepID=A0A7H0SLS7_9CORY|nr:DUF445 domain-containing protein [Corynebacterium poyangense]QNQ89502.1 DUF445 family protein [Corynebacterium poyangense]